MALFEVHTAIAAPQELVFDLARSIDLHVLSMADHGEIAVGGVTRGLIGFGESVTWQARHFLVSLRLTSRITAFERPRYFRDEMVSGPFARLSHDHVFERHGAGTLMRDVFDYEVPLGKLGKLADWLFLKAHMALLLERRSAVIKSVAESGDWSKYIDPSAGSGSVPATLSDDRR